MQESNGKSNSANERDKFNEILLDNMLEDTRKLYLLEDSNLDIKNPQKFIAKNFIIYHLEKITFEENIPRKEALENVISGIRVDGVNFIYLILGTQKGVEFYFGIVKDTNDKKGNKERVIDIDEVGEHILKPSILGNFRGSRLKAVPNRRGIIERISEMNNYAVLEGVPGNAEEKVRDSHESFQGMDRLVDVMTGDEFGVSIIASPLSLEEIEAIERELYDIHDRIAPRSKVSVQLSTSSNIGTGKSESNSSTQTNGRNENESDNSGKSFTKNNGTSNSKNMSSSTSGTNSGTSTAENQGKSRSKGTNSSSATSRSVTENSSRGESTSENKSVDHTKKCLIDWTKYLDEVVLKRLDYGKSKGLFQTNIFLFAKNQTVLYKLGNTMQSLFSGREGNKVPLLMREIINDPDNENTRNQALIKNIQTFQHPLVSLHQMDEKEREARIALSQNPSSNGGRFYLGNWMSTNELSLITGIPQKEVVGLEVIEEVEFGLNTNNRIDANDELHLGHMVRSGEPLNIPIAIDKTKLDKHTFITGVTGSGKTTTCLKILLGGDIPFLVIEPAKTEYRVLKNKFEDLLIFTLGDENVAPFRLNPFEIFKHENITSRVDMIKASIEAAFDMEAAIPQIIESALYRSYEDYGWNVTTNRNKQFEDPFADGVYSFPTISDLIRNVEIVADEQGFDDRLKNDYIGSIKARLQGLTVGAKGAMLNTNRSIDFEGLINGKVVLELEEIKNGNEKSLIIGFVLINLIEAIKANYFKSESEGKKFRHITLVEEAHRLLTKSEPGDNPSRKQGVETFADMLSEVRKYGESLIIVDQIPNKLTPEVLKNTNTKIIHKIFAKDDKDAIGNTIALTDEQKNFLSNLSVGRAILNSEGFAKPVQVQIEEDKSLSTTMNKPLSLDAIRNTALNYYANTYKRGVVKGVSYLKEKPASEVIRKYFDLGRDTEFEMHIVDFINQKKRSDKHMVLNAMLKDMNFELDEIVVYVYQYFYKRDRQNDDLKSYLATQFSNIMENEEYRILDDMADYYKI